MSLIDIIVGVKNEEKHIKRCINSLQNQSIFDINIIVVDGGSDDRTPGIVRKIQKKDNRVQLLQNPAEIISSGRNIGLNVSKAEYVAYLDGHCYVDEDWLKILYKTFLYCQEKYNLAGVGSTYSSPPDDSSFGKSVAYTLQTFFGGFGTAFTAGENIVKVDTVAFALYKKSILEEEHIIYDENMTQCEDTDFNHQLIKKDYILLKHPQAIVYQYRRKNLLEFSKQMIDYGKGRSKLAKKYKETLSPHHLIPVALFFYLLLMAVTLILFSFNKINYDTIILISIPFFIYVILDLFYAFTIIIRQQSLKHIYTIFIFPAIHIGYGVGFLKGLIMD
ncbi:MAG: glycosyltransferase [Euryarchaeota archaeon]|jgi:glycosyltransferase involved in cell wall biosynthesis|uniref:glycosyltransferase n=1 Tax=Methanobacterium sp. MZD130B TaxID=3394378 RepID=UPI0039FD022A|nr:glycosyltransferase [Euryarchaeota archaeon]